MCVLSVSIQYPVNFRSMARFFKYSQILSGDVPEGFGTANVVGSSMTIPGQGQDLAQIISSIVKLPPLDERTFDVGSGEEPDVRALAVKTDLEGLYEAEGVNLAQEAQERQKARKKAKEEAAQAKEPDAELATEEGDDK